MVVARDDVDAEHHPGHAGRVLMPGVMCAMRRVPVPSVVLAARRRLPAEPPLGGHMRGDVAMEQPLADALRTPRHRHRSAGRNNLGHDAWLLAFTEWRVLHAVAETLDLVVEAV